jgi:predicted ATP-grasp superfamily ATP-dependent carboligase
MGSAPAVLVTDGHLRSSLAVVRSLGHAGYRVFVCSPRRRSLAGASRFAITEAQIPSALSNPEAFADAVVDLVTRWKIDVVVPMSEEALLVLLPASERMAGVCIPFVPLDVFRRAADKRHVTELAATLGMAVPAQMVVESSDDVRTLGDPPFGFPVVVKPSKSVAGEATGRTKNGVSYAKDHEELVDRLSALPPASFPVLVQQRIEGPGTGIFLLRWNSATIAQFAHRRIREKPPSGGVSVCAESVAIDPPTAAAATRLLDALSWEGPAMVEFKQDARTGVRYLMEINGRFWGSLQLAIDSGVDFPALLVKAAMGNEITPALEYRVGVRLRWWWGEVDHLIARLRRNYGRAFGGRWQAIRDFVLPGRGALNEVLRADDPRPFLRETLDWFQGR